MVLIYPVSEMRMALGRRQSGAEQEGREAECV